VPRLAGDPGERTEMGQNSMRGSALTGQGLASETRLACVSSGRENAIAPPGDREGERLDSADGLR